MGNKRKIAANFTDPGILPQAFFFLEIHPNSKAEPSCRI
jgi:hypothetical protein